MLIRSYHSKKRFRGQFEKWHQLKLFLEMKINFNLIEKSNGNQTFIQNAEL